jgi:DNA (cytosine-5)-methyltransferase 1
VLVPRYGERPGQAPRARSAQLPLPTIVTTDNGAQVVAAYLAKQNGVGEKIVLGQDVHRAGAHHHDEGSEGRRHLAPAQDAPPQRRPGRARAARHDQRQPTARTSPKSARCSSSITPRAASGDLCKEPIDTITTKDRLGLVTVTIKGEEYAIVDIGLRMLTPRELYKAQGFPENYKIDNGVVASIRRRPPQARRIRFTKTAQVRMCGNSVCPPVAAAIMEAQLRRRHRQKEEVA